MDRILSLLGFAKKAGKLVTGSNAVLRSILSLEAGIVIVNEDAGKSVKEKFARLCRENDIKFYILGRGEEFERATGERNKIIYSVTDEGFSGKLVQLAEGLEKNNGGAVIG